MIKFEIKKSTTEVKYKDRYEIEKGITTDRQEDSEIMGRFDSLDDAEMYLKSYHSEIIKHSNYFEVKEFFIEENEYDDEDPDEWIDTKGIHEYSEFRIQVVTKPGYEVVGIYNNYKDAESVAYDCDEETDFIFN